jgi:ubiquinone/menaquinone biosynthesis C-methylase UbiE
LPILSSIRKQLVKHQCGRPNGWVGRWLLRDMNERHSGVTDWGLSHFTIPRDGAILDVGCGGGRTIAKLAAASGSGRVCGLDYSAESVSLAAKLNAEAIRAGRVEIREGSVSQLPYESSTFDLVTAVETIYFWPDLAADTREVWRVVKPGGMIAIICEVYKGAGTPMSIMVEKCALEYKMKMLSPEEHRALLQSAGFVEVQVFTDQAQGWVCSMGLKPLVAL